MTTPACVPRLPERPLGETVADAMLHRPDTFPLDASASDLREFFESDHAHAALVVDHRGRLRSVIERADLGNHEPRAPITTLGRLAGRTVDADADLGRTWHTMTSRKLRRLAVTHPGTDVLLGLLCLKRSGLGFCSDADVAARRADSRSAR